MYPITKLGLVFLQKIDNMNLHITHDDKFIDDFIANTRKYSDIKQNIFLIYTIGEATKLKFVKSPNVVTIDLFSHDFINEITDFKNYDKIFIHYLSDELVPFIQLIPKKIKVYWIFWGADAFNMSAFQKYTFSQKTKEIIQPSQLNFIQNLKRIKRNFHKYKAERNKIKSIKRINYFAHYIKNDYDFIYSKLKLKPPKYINFSYADLENFISESPTDYSLKRNFVLIGNSASPTNNHFDAIGWLSNKIGINYDIYCPLSYSGTPDYIEEVITEGTKNFNKNFMPLTEYIPKEKYLKVINNTAIAVMWHLRSQAWGNIIALLMNGTKVFMSNKSNLYKYLKSIDLIVFSIEDDADEINNPKFSYSNIATRNKQILEIHYGADSVKKRFKNLLENE